jgi:RNA polymerase sigma factor (TIGR02999 family)
MQNVELTQLLARWSAGDRSSEPELFTHIYPILKSLAKSHLRGQGRLTIQATDLAHEAYLELCKMQSPIVGRREQFFGLVATMIRRIIVDHLRARGAQKRGNNEPRLSLDQIQDSDMATQDTVDWGWLDQCLDELAISDPTSASLIELKFFMGMTSQEIAQAKQCSQSSVERQWRFARAWLQQKLGAV